MMSIATLRPPLPCPNYTYTHTSTNIHTHRSSVCRHTRPTSLRKSFLLCKTNPHHYTRNGAADLRLRTDSRTVSWQGREAMKRPASSQSFRILSPQKKTRIERRIRLRRDERPSLREAMCGRRWSHLCRAIARSLAKHPGWGGAQTTAEDKNIKGKLKRKCSRK